ncbi:hypothetical protein F5Y10DRAFT_263344 [Nemania abortiva]|nr:hypothetical protein F5Y10DRAFT_263344 [Nemania abortiva]
MRCVADMIQKVGLLTKRGLYRLPMVSKEWLAGHEMPLNRPWAPETFPLATHAGAVPEADRTIREALEEEHSIVKHDVRVTALALWDTVSSMGIPWPALLRQPTSTSLTFVGSDLRGVDYAFQALALHESRWNFPAVVLRQPSDTNMHLQQCWFAGYHADVGGGRMQDALGHIALAWIFGKLRHYNILDFDESLFWTPLFNGPSFKIDRSTNRLVVNIKSSMSKPYRFLGSKHRIPRCQFWDNLGRPVEVNPTQDSAKTDTSHEEIHALVRPLLQEKRIPRPPALQDTNIPSRGGAWTIKGDDGRNFEVKQAPMSYFEASILVDWLGKELIKMQMDASIPFQIEEECRLLAEEIQHVLLED